MFYTLQHRIITFVLFFFLASVASAGSQNFQEVVRQITEQGQKLVQNYDPGNRLETMNGISQLYFTLYEDSGMEHAVNTTAPDNNQLTEQAFMHLISAMHQAAPVQEVTKLWITLQKQLLHDLSLLPPYKHRASFWETFLQSALILIREGFEALLIITALVAYLHRANATEKLKIIYRSVFAALLASGLTAYVFHRWISHSGANREFLEGCSMLIAAALLLYVSYWLFGHGKRQKDALQKNVQLALTQGSSFALATTAFLAIYREGAEVILFYHALAISNTQSSTMTLLCGCAAAIIVLLILYRLMRSATVRIPYRLFFKGTALFLYYMAFTFVGRAILEFQEASWISITPLKFIPTIDVLGIYPSKEGVLAQLFFLIPTSLGGALIWWYKKTFSPPTAITA